MNPLLKTDQLPDFSAFHVEHIKPAVTAVLSESRDVVEKLVADTAMPSWENFVEPLEHIQNRLERVWGPVGHLDAVKNSDEWHQVYTDCLQQITDFHSQMGQNKGLFAKFSQLHQSDAFTHYSLAQKKVIENALRDFRLSGIDLDEAQQQTYKDITQQLSQLSSQFGNNVLKSSQAWSKYIEDRALLSGLPDSAMGLLAQLAEQKSYQQGWLVTLDFPSYLAVMTYAENRELREEVYRAFATRASEMAQDTQYDNSALMADILKLRHQKAELLGCQNYAELSLATKMADSTDQVIQFLTDLAQKSKPQAQQEFETLSQFAKTELGLSSLQPWDVTFVSEKLKNQSLSLSQEALRPYFPVTKVLAGLFKITETLFGVTVTEKQGVSAWHEAVRFFEISNESGQVIAAFYLDLYARENKRGGAWMDSAISRWQSSHGELQTPVAYLVCNFTPPVDDQPACLTHNEVTTLFHEFGHGLHHMLTEMDDFDVSGINGVPWDAVELPSQFMENFCWEPEGIELMTAHIETQQPLPEDLFKALKQSRGFQSAMMMVRQLEFSLFDFLLHTHYQPDAPTDILALANDVRQKVAVVFPPDYHRFPHSFSHIFAGGYAAGYFSYKWAEVLSADAFGAFEEQGILNTEVGRKFKNTILAAGGSIHPMTLFKAFRGREPQIDALLRHSGIRSA
ncbi:oligopeptidase A [Hydrogenovibrio sp. SC-1]|uniref:M3 family metallopeptidase n=1 Tax=Hydrogenovibrio sp. SC-1 TaxID=2065820 RepID=UPI000C7D8350|nr:M3 family metallopeptidase [Hydrogenovibrio sp. SC-1]PLA75318.1 oligopeptidase A [Hydrogenovibrio sp. SC-1]